jgi:hypothetical protein
LTRFGGHLTVWTGGVRKAGAFHAGLEIVRHDQLGYAPEIFEGAHVRTAPVLPLLAQRRLGVSVVARTQRGDAQLRRLALPGGRIPDRDRAEWLGK